MSVSWFSDYSKRIKLTIDSTNIDSDLTDFPVLVTLISGTNATAVFDELATVSGTKKIALTTDNGTSQCNVEIERWDWSNEKANLWVKIPTVSSGTNTDLYLYYDSDHADNTDYVGDTGDTAAQSVWDDNFKAVYHMAQDPNGDVANAIKDSTSNANDGTPAGTMVSADLVDGKIGKGIDFDGNDDRIDLNTGLEDDPSILMVEIVGKNLGTEGMWFSHRSEAIRLLQIYTPSNTEVNFQMRSSGNSLQTVAKTGLTLTNFTYATAIFDKVSDNHKLYINDLSVETLNYDFGSETFTSTKDILGAFYDTAYQTSLLGVLDEVRISNVVRTDAWIKATYYSNWDELVSFSEPPVTFVFTNPIPAHLSTVYGTTKQLHLTTTISGEEPNYVYDASFYDSFDVQIGTAVSGIQSGQPAESNAYLSTPGGIDYSWYMIATSSGSEDTSDTYTFHNKFLASGTTKINGTLASGIDVRLYLRDTGELLGSTISTISGTFNIETQHNAEFYCVALSPYTDTNSLVYDFLEVD